MISHFDKLVEILQRWTPKGERQLADGTRLICPTPHVAPEAWLHALFAALREEEVQELERRCGLPLPNDFRSFLLHANGALIFSRQIAIWGLRKSYVRTGDEAWQPFDLPSQNEGAMRPGGSPSELFFFGSEERGASWCFFDAKDASYRVGKTPREHFNPTRYWPSFWHWLLERSESLAAQYDCTGAPVAVYADQ